MDEIRIQLELNPSHTARSLLDDLIKNNPEKFNIGNLRTLQRKIALWKKEQLKMKQQQYLQTASTSENEINKYISVLANSIING